MEQATLILALLSVSVLARAKREGWTREIQSAKALAKREDAALAVDPSEAAAMSM